MTVRTGAAGALVFLLLGVIVSGGSAAPVALNISKDSGASRLPSISVSGLTVKILWEDDTPGNADIFFARSTDGGATFGGKVNLSQTAGASTCYDWVSSGRAEFVIWTDAVTSTNSEIYLRRSTDNGGSFLPAVNLSANAGQSLCPAIEVAGGGLVFVVWTDHSSGNDEILLRRSLDGGATWIGAQNLSTTGAPSANPKIAAFGPNVYVMWEEGTAPTREVYLRRSTDGGATFAPAVNVSKSAGDSFRPRFTVTGPMVYVTYRDESSGNADILLKTSGNGGATFGSAVNLSTNSGRSTSQRIFVSGMFLYVVWLDNTTGNDEVYLRRSTNGGATWEAIKNLSSDPGDTDSLDRSLGGTTFHAIWDDSSPGNFDIFYRRSTNAGSTFASAVNLSANTGDSLNPQVVTSFRDLYIAWDDTTPGNREILFLRSLNGGQSFGLAADDDGGALAPDRDSGIVEWCVQALPAGEVPLAVLPVGPCR